MNQSLTPFVPVHGTAIESLQIKINRRKAVLYYKNSVPGKTLYENRLFSYTGIPGLGLDTGRFATGNFLRPANPPSRNHNTTPLLFGMTQRLSATS